MDYPHLTVGLQQRLMGEQSQDLSLQEDSPMNLLVQQDNLMNGLVLRFDWLNGNLQRKENVRTALQEICPWGNDSGEWCGLCGTKICEKDN